MKGPSGRLKFDVRRLWQCPRCQHKELISGRVVNRHCCKCQTQGDPPGPAWMTLVEETKPKPGDAGDKRPEFEAGMSQPGGE